MGGVDKGLQLYLCLFASQGYDLRSLLRDGSPDEQLAAAIRKIWHQRSEQYSALRSALPPGSLPQGRRVEMSYIGG